ncbi:TetR/AcrR family transcriptional regulator [Niallia sp. NCCP-28]|uniref:TetR/AcrR family transcriptional regulator n=1 Tax=Niallia sp. NCCP-28 TaxID=2934712 RepID=UPI0020895A96|nr:TetR/AcrR family transcriptional regulator [Niallia sp. NCCP-28]GKU80637.1 TetR family transcriptional regulator [Niallia sp. NCCP-28]
MENNESKQSFIAEARREQIIKAAIDTLEEIGFVSASLAKIAKKAKISTGLISYHFANKLDLMNSTLEYLLITHFAFIRSKVEQKETAKDKLAAFIESSLVYQETQKANNIALIEIIFNARTEDHIPYYQLQDEEEGDPIQELLESILNQGKQTKEFGEFDNGLVKQMIIGAISERMFSSINEEIEFESYFHELNRLILKLVQ